MNRTVFEIKYTKEFNTELIGYTDDPSTVNIDQILGERQFAPGGGGTINATPGVFRPIYNNRYGTFEIVFGPLEERRPIQSFTDYQLPCNSTQERFGKKLNNNDS